MSQIRKLAGQTAYYGISSILGRVLNFLLLPIWTDRLLAGAFGTVSNLYAYIAIFLIIYTYGMETAFFRFTAKSKDPKVYHSIATAVLFTSCLISLIIGLNSTGIARFLGEDVQPIYIQYIAIILFLDAIVAIPFASLRLEEKALRFAFIKTIVIVLTITLNLLLIIVLPDITAGKYLVQWQPWVNSFFRSDFQVGYILIANLVANAIYLPLLFPELKKIKLTWDFKLLKPMLIYALPIFLMGLGGMINEQGYNIIMKRILGVESLGIFSSTVKLSVIMMLGIQAFRYAAEPFFFNHADNKNAPELFARVMHYFVVFNVVVLVAVALNGKLIGDVFLRSPAYKEALYILPVLLVAKLFYGVYVNLSVWFKIKDQTIFGTYFAMIGAIITILGNLLLIPSIGFYGSAFTSILCYLSMSILCYWKGKKIFPVPYNFLPLLGYLLLGLLFIYGGMQVQITNVYLGYALQFLLTLIFMGFMFWKEGRNLGYKVRNTKS